MIRNRRLKTGGFCLIRIQYTKIERWSSGVISHNEVRYPVYLGISNDGLIDSKDRSVHYVRGLQIPLNNEEY